MCKYLDFKTLWTLAQTCKGFLSIIWGSFNGDGRLVRENDSFLGYYPRFLSFLRNSQLVPALDSTITIHPGASINRVVYNTVERHIFPLYDTYAGEYKLHKIRFSKKQSRATLVIFQQVGGRSQIVVVPNGHLELKLRTSEQARYKTYIVSGHRTCGYTCILDYSHTMYPTTFEEFAERAGLDWKPGDALPTHLGKRAEFGRTRWEAQEVYTKTIGSEFDGFTFSEWFHNIQFTRTIHYVN